jgi:photosystem II stability/assembly factor-like uncharacterized protein
MSPRLVPLVGALVALGLGGAARGDWRSVPLYGGDVRSVTILPSDPDTVLAGTSSGQVWISRDGAASWRLPGERRVVLPGWVVSHLVFDPHHEGRVWAALWSLWGGSGSVVYSQDMGATWTARTEGLPGIQVYRLAFDPSRAGRIYAATRSGVYATDDFGSSWRLSTGDLPGLGKVTSLLVDADDPAIVYAGTWQRAYRSDDRGETWAGIFDGMVVDSEVFAIRPGPNGPGELWASTCGWVYHGTERGARWRRHERGLAERRTPAFEVLANGRLLAGTVSGLYSSDDAGESWVLRSPQELAISAIAVHPRNPGRVLLATEGAGVWRSDDGATSFHSVMEGMTSLRVSDLERNGHDVLMAIRHAGQASGIHATHPIALDLRNEPGLTPTVLDLAVQGETLYAATEQGLFVRATGAWLRVEEVGTGRVEEVEVGPGGVAARAVDGVWVSRGGPFTAVPSRIGSPQRIQWVGDSLWISDRWGIFSVDGGPVPAPPGATTLLRVGERSLWSGGEGVWVSPTTGGAPPWKRLAARPARALATGDERFPVLFLGEGKGGMLYDRDLKGLELELPIESRDVTAAVLSGNRLFVGTPGNGLLYADMLLVE